MPKPVVHFELSVHDDAKTAEFYRSLFDWEIKYYDEHKAYGIATTGEKSIGGDIQRNDSTFPSHCAIYVEVEDIVACLEKAERLGAMKVFGPNDLGKGYGSIGMFRDPEGILMGLFQKP